MIIILGGGWCLWGRLGDSDFLSLSESCFRGCASFMQIRPIIHSRFVHFSLLGSKDTFFKKTTSSKMMREKESHHVHSIDNTERGDWRGRQGETRTRPSVRPSIRPSSVRQDLGPELGAVWSGQETPAGVNTDLFAHWSHKLGTHWRSSQRGSANRFSCFEQLRPLGGLLIPQRRAPFCLSLLCL